MKTLAKILRSNWTLILGVGVLVGITMLNAGCDDGILGWRSYDQFGGWGGSSYW